MLITSEKSVTERERPGGLAVLLAYPEIFLGRVAGLNLFGGDFDTRIFSSIMMRGLI